MTLINKEVYERRVLVSGDINFQSKSIIDITNLVNNLIDEMVMELGETNGNNPGLRDFD